MHHGNVVVWQVHAGVVFLERCVIPFLYGSEEDAGQRLSGEFHLRRTGKIVGWDHSTQHGREMQNLALLDGGELLIGHGHVGSPEVHGTLSKLLDSSAGTDRLIVDLNVG